LRRKIVLSIELILKPFGRK
jgi:hypothetical protein